MASVKMVKASAAPKGAPRAAKAAAPGDFILTDLEDDSVSVQGADAHGHPVDISKVASIAVTSDSPAVLTVTTPMGMTFSMSALAPGHVIVTIVATWTDGSVGPFTAILPVDVTGSPATGLLIVPGVPTIRP